MKILDLGAHDGYVTAWLKDRYAGDLHVDGIELMPAAAEKARERGINCVVGSAEDAPVLFQPRSYDAVVAFEVLEHVPDVPRFLSACEEMLKPGGRCYISTPDGTFGTGHNPHHLRALRSIDVADLLRRRGTLHDMHVGADTVTVASYSPAPRLGEIAIYLGPCWSRWQPSDIFTRGLGGSETAAVYLALELSELGYIVTVYGDVEEGAFRDVIFRDWRTFDPTVPRQAVISSRTPELVDRPIAAEQVLLWMHDTDYGDRLTPERAEKFDTILTLSEWHTSHVRKLYPFLLEADVEQIRNGVNHKLFAGAAPARRKRVVYTSSPDRGIDVILELWPRVLEEVPDAELAFAYSPVYSEIAAKDPTVGAHAARVHELADQPGVTASDPLSQPDVAKLMRTSLVWVAPSYNTPLDVAFEETSCIGAMEAQAAGCLIVASNWGALPETVQVGRLVDGPGRSTAWEDAFVQEIIDGLTSAETQEWAQTEGPKAAAWLGWDGVAARVAAIADPTPAESTA